MRLRLIGVKAVLGFLTIIPVNGSELEETAEHAWLFPVIGALMALIAVSLGYALTYILSRGISLALTFFVLLLLTGFHHLDGLLDIGDALMVRKSSEERLRVLHDSRVGAGGFGLAFFVLLVSYSALIETGEPFRALIAAETLAKFAMVLGMYVGRPSHSGIGSTFIEVVSRDKRQLILALLSCLILIIPLTMTKGLGLLLATVVFTLLLVRLFERAFNGIGGDAFGAINELVRMLVLVVIT
ncbi:MAG: adenosylcobinamide-GDP ribazoletransferase [Candidatus Hydrothermarchaeales archaeon]